MLSMPWWLLMSDVTQPLTEVEAAVVVSNRDFGFAGLRMLPKKEKGVRLITNMSRRTRSKAVRVKGQSNFKKPPEHAGTVTVPAADEPKPADGDKAHRLDKDSVAPAVGTGSNPPNGAATAPNATNATHVHYKRDRSRSINDALIDAFLVLKHEKLHNPACWGASVRSHPAPRDC